MTETFNKIIWDLGSSYRNSSLKDQYLELKESENYSLEDLKLLQFRKLKELMLFALHYSKFYKEIFTIINFNPHTDFNCIEDLFKIPPISKLDLIDNVESNHSSCHFSKLFNSESSGTSGQSLHFLKDEYWDSFNRASKMRGFSWHNVKIWEKNGYLWGYNVSFTKRLKTIFLDWLQNRFRLFTYDNNDIEKFVRKLKNATYISGYSSMIYEVAKRINMYYPDSAFKNLKMVCGTSEKILESYQPEVKKAFGKRMINEYGAAEAGLIAFECKHGYMHVNMEGVLVEEVEGEIIVTNLVARSFPVIRYKLGDYIVLKDKNFRCPCGLQHQVIESITGRVGKLIHGKQQTYPSLTLYYIFKNLALTSDLELNYQAIQNEKGQLTINVEQELNPTQILNLKNEALKYFNSDMNLKIITSQPLRSNKGKFVDFISYLS
jgi:phenylacetate-CoA ligase